MHFQSHVHIEHAKNWVELLGVARRVKKGATKTASLLPPMHGKASIGEPKMLQPLESLEIENRLYILNMCKPSHRDIYSFCITKVLIWFDISALNYIKLVLDKYQERSN